MRIEDDAVAKELLDGPYLMRLAYVGANGQPHVVPIWYGYREGEFIVVTGPKADKARHLAANPKVSFTIDSPTPPYKVLLVEGVATLEETEGMAPEYPEIVTRFLGDFAERYLANMRERVKRQVRIRIRPTSWRVIDFVQRFPKSLR